MTLHQSPRLACWFSSLGVDEYEHICSLLPLSSLLRVRVCRSLRDMFLNHVDKSTRVWLPMARAANVIFNSITDETAVLPNMQSLLSCMSVFHLRETLPLNASYCWSLFAAVRRDADEAVVGIALSSFEDWRLIDEMGLNLKMHVDWVADESEIFDDEGWFWTIKTHIDLYICTNHGVTKITTCDMTRDTTHDDDACFKCKMNDRVTLYGDGDRVEIHIWSQKRTANELAAELAHGNHSVVNEFVLERFREVDGPSVTLLKV